MEIISFYYSGMQGFTQRLMDSTVFLVCWASMQTLFFILSLIWCRFSFSLHTDHSRSRWGASWSELAKGHLHILCRSWRTGKTCFMRQYLQLLPLTILKWTHSGTCAIRWIILCLRFFVFFFSFRTIAFINYDSISYTIVPMNRHAHVLIFFHCFCLCIQFSGRRC